jgi:hypothetical protein
MMKVDDVFECSLVRIMPDRVGHLRGDLGQSCDFLKHIILFAPFFNRIHLPPVLWFLSPVL